MEGADGIRECQGCGTVPDGTPFRFELLTYSEYGEPLSLTQQLIAEMLKDVGIQADLSQVQGPVLWADSSSGGLEQTGNFEIDLYDDGYAGNDPTDFIWQYYYSESAQPDYGWNVGRWTYSGFDELVDAAYTLDEAERAAAFCEMATILDAELPQILLFSTVNAEAYSTRVQSVEARQQRRQLELGGLDAHEITPAGRERELAAPPPCLRAGNRGSSRPPCR